MHSDRTRDLGLFRWDQRGMASEGNGSDAILAQWNQHGVNPAGWHSLPSHPSRELSEEDCGGGEPCDRSVGDKLEHRFDKHDSVDFRGGRLLSASPHAIALKPAHPVYGGEDIGRKIHRVGGGGRPAGCQVEGCAADLGACKGYHQKHKVCETHAKATSVLVGGHEQRFCQQCSRFHLLAEFDEGKRSCRGRLSGHNKRRRKSTMDNGPENPVALVPVSVRNAAPEVEEPEMMDITLLELRRGQLAARSKEEIIMGMTQMEAVLREKSDMIDKMTSLLKSYVQATDNYRSRERSLKQALSVETFAAGMFDVVDELVQVKTSVPDEYRWDVPGSVLDPVAAAKLVKSLLDGVASAEANILRVFRQHGFDRFDATGEQFNSARHKHVMEFTDSTKESDTVSLTVKAGFTYNGTVMRQAEVHVARGSSM